MANSLSGQDLLKPSYMHWGLSHVDQAFAVKMAE